jgi:hypothetical protein
MLRFYGNCAAVLRRLRPINGGKKLKREEKKKGRAPPDSRALPGHEAKP